MNWLALVSPMNVVVWLTAVNLAAFAAFGIDKAKARAGERRISEANLLMLAWLGGTVGAFAGRSLFRHKTRKQPFSSILQIIGIVQFAVLVGLVIFLLP